MLDKSYYDNMPSKNILNSYKPKNLTTDLSHNYSDSSLENMIINSNLDDENIIK